MLSLQESVLSQWRVWDTVSLRLLQMLLAADCTSAVRVQQVRLFFRDDFLRLLPPLHNLTTLAIQVRVFSSLRSTSRPSPYSWDSCPCTQYLMTLVIQVRVLPLYTVPRDPHQTDERRVLSRQPKKLHTCEMISGLGLSSLYIYIFIYFNKLNTAAPQQLLKLIVPLLLAQLLRRLYAQFLFMIDCKLQ